MATQDAGLRDQEEGARAQQLPPAEKISLVVDRPPPDRQAVLILPFAASRTEDVLGRQIGSVLQQRLHSLPTLISGHGLLITSLGGGRRYLPLYQPLSVEHAVACGASWGAVAVLYGSITLQPALRWSMILQDVRSKQVLFEDTLFGEPEDLFDALSDMAMATAHALNIPLDAVQQASLAKHETRQLDALLAYLDALDLRPQYGVMHTDPQGERRHLLRALAYDPAFKAPVDMLISDVLESPGALGDLIALMKTMGAPGTTGLGLLAQALEDLGHTEHAGRLVAAVLEQEPAQDLALAVAGQHAYRAGHYAEARALAQAVLDAQPEDARAHALLGNLLAASQRIPGAAIYWDVALSYDPNQPTVLQRLGAYLVAAGEYQRAYDVLSRAVSLGALSADSLYQLGVAAYRLGHNAEAVGALHLALQREPNRADIHFMLARSYLRAGNAEIALFHDDRALDLLPTFWPSALALGYAALNAGRDADGLKAYTLVAGARPDLPEALYGLGIALVANNMVPEAIEVLERARALHPRDVGIICALAMAYLRAGRLREARLSVQYALRLAPDSADVALCVDALIRQERS